jgi:hypothetical protein
VGSNGVDQEAVVRGGVLLELDIEHGTLPGDAAEASIAALIERRAQEREQADREASVWAKSARAFDLAAAAERRRAWAVYHQDLARLHARLSEEHREKALQLSDGAASS